MRRTLLAAAPPAIAIGLAWQTVEVPGRSWSLLAVALAGLLPALLPTVGQRVAASVVLVSAIALGAARTGPRGTLDQLVEGGRIAGTAASPYDPAAYPSLHLAVLVLVAVTVVVLGLAVAAGRGLTAGAVGAAAIAWPTTLSAAPEATWGVVALAAALWPTIALRVRGGRALAVAIGGVGVVAAGALAVADAGATPSGAQVDWRSWNPLTSHGPRVGVRYVWDATYAGITFPARPTVVLRVTGPERALYWRASTLDSFLGDRWIENLYPRQIARPGVLPGDPLLPPVARAAAGWVAQEVEVAALDEDRVVAAAQPMRIAAELDRAYYLSGGVIAGDERLRRGDTYRVWSYTPSPSPRRLARSPARYPAATARYLELGRARLPAFGVPGRAGAVERVLVDERYPDLAPYAPLWREAQRLAAGTGSPYVATLAIERWLRISGGFAYDERPSAPPAGLPPLVHFATVGRAGYCQHYAGTMAVMLRLLGVPARVAVGFSSGRRDGDTWIVTDHDAHAWVEVWLAGHGWLPFDPTPGRGTLSASYTLASDSADAVRALGTGRFLDFEPAPTGGSAVTPSEPTPVTASARIPAWAQALGAVLASLALAGVSILVAKRVRRRRRLAGTDPRAIAAGIRLELADVLRDHGVTVGRATPLHELGRAASRVLQVPAAALVASTEAARYGPPSEADTAARRARDELRALLRSARGRVGPARALRAALHPRSLRGA